MTDQDQVKLHKHFLRVGLGPLKLSLYPNIDIRSFSDSLVAQYPSFHEVENMDPCGCVDFDGS